LRGSVRVGGSASPGASARELAIGLVAAFVDALQAFRDDCLQLREFLLLLGFFRIHRNRCYDVNGDRAATECDGAWKLTVALSETPTG
jgi:hypothetical protein